VKVGKDATHIDVAVDIDTNKELFFVAVDTNKEIFFDVAVAVDIDVFS
jgi:hypothetical protein